MKNKLTDLNDHLFAQMERLSDENMSAEAIEREHKRSQAIVAVEELTRELMCNIKAHYLSRPTSRATAQEALNALAICVAMIVAAARQVGDEDGATEFFDRALEQQLEELAA